MTLGFVVAMIRSAILQTITMAAPVLLVAMFIGLVVSIFQATTSIQDQTLTFVPKIIAILVTIGLTGTWMMSRMVNFTTNLMQLIPDL